MYFGRKTNKVTGQADHFLPSTLLKPKTQLRNDLSKAPYHCSILFKINTEVQEEDSSFCCEHVRVGAELEEEG